MAIDYHIEYDCPLEDALMATGIIQRLKQRQRAQEVIQWVSSARDELLQAQLDF